MMDFSVWVRPAWSGAEKSGSRAAHGWPGLDVLPVQRGQGGQRKPGDSTHIDLV